MKDKNCKTIFKILNKQYLIYFIKYFNNNHYIETNIVLIYKLIIFNYFYNFLCAIYCKLKKTVQS